MKKNDVVSYFGGVGEVAKVLGISHASVSGWGDLIPKGRAFELQALTSGKLEVNPGLYAKDSNKAVEQTPQHRGTNRGSE